MHIRFVSFCHSNFGDSFSEYQEVQRADQVFGILYGECNSKSSSWTGSDGLAH